ncbi:H/ACA ribonucleoprotein complex subunit 1 protein, partial [Biomphalaria glabrata]
VLAEVVVVEMDLTGAEEVVEDLTGGEAGVVTEEEEGLIIDLDKANFNVY